MTGRWLLAMAAMLGGSAIAGEPAADRVTLRDGSVALGLVTAATTGARGSVELVVRRDWARGALPKQAALWEKAAARTSRVAIDQRRKRLEAWRRERVAGAANRKPAAAGAKGEDRILTWIDGERKRLADPAAVDGSRLMSIKLPRGEIRGLERRPAGVERMIRLAWICELPDPETMSAKDLKDALESRGYAVDQAVKSAPQSLDKLLPPATETDAAWLVRRAATEVSVDSGLRFVRYQNLLYPDTPMGPATGGLGLSTALEELKRLLNPDARPAVDPLVKELLTIESAGGAGAVVTRLEMLPDLAGAVVEVTLWVRQARQSWVPAGSHSATVRSGDVQAGAAGAIAADPQVQGAFQVIESLGFGQIGAELKQASVNIGAATQKALETARSEFNQDLNGLALPVLEPGPAAPAATPPTPK